MCGIAGSFARDGRSADEGRLWAMTRALAHRGPDGEGIYRDREVGLGHRRLAILDLSPAAHQPMATPDGQFVLSYNGELYNHAALRHELEAEGVAFRSRSDTEVLLHLLARDGEAALARLNGIFAFAFWDRARRRLLLARDRYGVKPLYLTRVDGVLLFASEVGALVAGGYRPRVNGRALRDYFTFQNTFAAETLFAGVELLPPGTVVTLGDGEERRREYWRFDFTPRWTGSEAEATARLGELLTGAVKRQMVADVPVGAYLSGGMDSGSLTALAARQTPRLMTFTGGFDLTNVSGFEAGFDERKDAEVLSAQFGTEHYQMVFHAGDLEWALPRVVRHLEDLRVGMCYPYYYTARLASRFVKVVLAGTGGDELLAGYPWRYEQAAAAADHRSFVDGYFRYWSRLVPPAAQLAFFTPEALALAGGHDPRDSFAAIADEARGLDDPLRKALHLEARTFLHGLLVVEDKLSMAHSLESRVPLLDNEVVDFATGLPTALLVNYGWAKNPTRDPNLAGKYVFRRAMEGVLPDAILTKRKQGFSAPEQAWYMGPLTDYVRRELLGPRAALLQLIEHQAIARVLDEHTSGKANHRLLIWSLLCFERWCRIFLLGESDDAGPAR